MNILLFFILNLINVILGTMRSILTVKAKQSIAIVINTLSYTFYAGIVKLISGQSLVIVLITTALTNLIGVYIATSIIKKIQPQKLWVIDLTISDKIKLNILYELNTYNLQYSVFDIENSNFLNIKVYSYDKEESRKIKKIIEKYKSNIKYNIQETKGTF